MADWKLAISFLIGFLGQPLGYIMVWDAVMDGPCSGVWSPIAFHCHLNVVLWCVACLFLPILMFRNFRVGLWVCAGFGASAILMELYGHILGYGTFFFASNFYRPVIMEIWTGLYGFLAVFLFIFVWVLKKGVKNV